MAVINFQSKKRPNPKVFVCNCGCEGFWLYEDGRIECQECNTFHDSHSGYWKLIDPAGVIEYRVRQPDGTYITEPGGASNK